MNFIHRGRRAEDHTKLGAKARALAALRSSRLPIPPWFVIGPDAFHACLTPAQRDELASATDVFRIHALLEELKPTSAVCAHIRRALDELCPNREQVAVRSSASDEDGRQHSFAGQLDSYLCVAPDQIVDKVVAVWRSGFGERVLAYRREHGLPLVPQPPSVLVQRMVAADVAGVAFAADPVSGRRNVAVISAVYGLGTSLVSGECDADTYHVDHDGHILSREVADKKWAHRSSPQGGVDRERVGREAATCPCLNESDVAQIAELVRTTSRHLERPQDIEWALQNGKLFLLQSRPITSLAELPDPDGMLTLWDNSNIAESYSGVTTPLTFSFARHAYEGVYREFCRIMGVPASTLQAHTDTFRCMLGLIRGRVYYNLINWYRMLSLLPGFKSNRHFMEQMMGVKEKLPEPILDDLNRTRRRERLIDGLRLLNTLRGMLVNHFTLSRRIRRFHQRLDELLRRPQSPLDAMGPQELAGYYRDLERKLLTRWDAPIINDFFAMIFHGVLRRQAQKWCGDKEGTLQNGLLCGEGGMISAEPAQRVREMAETVRQDAELVELLCDGSLDTILTAAQRVPEFGSLYEDYLAKFGDRCVEELKLESRTLDDDPLPLLRSIGHFARRVLTSDSDLPAGVSAEMRRVAEGHVREKLRFRPLRRLLFRWILRHARARVRDRENLRFQRTRLFGRVRRIFLEIGRHYHALDLLDRPRDVFYLEVDEVLGFINGTTTTADLKGLIEVRKAEFADYRTSRPPEDRFETRGVVHQGNRFRSIDSSAGVTRGHSLKGIGCCPGVVRGPVRVITDPRRAALKYGEILVAERTDPGWIIVFPSAAGVLVERGSLLSHSAILAREMGIPAIVSISGLTAWLNDGDWVELDGSTGVVSRIDAAAEAAHEN